MLSVIEALKLVWSPFRERRKRHAPYKQPIYFAPPDIRNESGFLTPLQRCDVPFADEGYDPSGAQIVRSFGNMRHRACHDTLTETVFGGICAFEYRFDLSESRNDIYVYGYNFLVYS